MQALATVSRRRRGRRARRGSGVVSCQKYVVESAPMPRVPVSAIIHTLNEIENIEDCLRSVEWADEIYLVDAFSTDGTVALIRQKFPPVRLGQPEYLGAASQKNYAIYRPSNDWIC